MLYSAIRRLLFALDPEKAQHVALAGLARCHALGLTGWLAPPPPSAPRRVMGIDFPNPVGLAAGFDKNGEYIDLMAALGFGFIEIGTVTPRPQPGNPSPRVFRIPEHEAIVNRFGFNNVGLERLLANVERSRFNGILGINIGKNFDTPLERAHEDYVHGLRAVYGHASYVAVNISSPNTTGLRNLQNAEELDALLAVLKSEQCTLKAAHGRYVPIAVKIAPDLSFGQIDAVAGLLLKHGMDGAIATNTTLSREGIEDSPWAKEAGGLSGAPLRARATAVLRRLCQALDGRLPVIGVGGILGGKDAVEKMEAGASLVQLYTGLVYRGPKLVREVVSAILEREGATARPNRLPT
ncbi:MAG TPA: quinone-dependent dihydroorotate dehydrogenase [Burkholderiales bacterium]|nr:quinone-dependent dihydroorotate dehydrogenase [Burkholderiales bacterium]